MKKIFKSVKKQFFNFIDICENTSKNNKIFLKLKDMKVILFVQIVKDKED